MGLMTALPWSSSRLKSLLQRWLGVGMGVMVGVLVFLGVMLHLLVRAAMFAQHGAERKTPWKKSGPEPGEGFPRPAGKEARNRLPWWRYHSTATERNPCPSPCPIPSWSSRLTGATRSTSTRPPKRYRRILSLE